MTERSYKKEISFWDNQIQNSIYWFVQKGSGVRLDKTLKREIVKITSLRKMHTLNIVDIGCGPISTVGTVDDRFRINLLGVDPLTNVYSKILDQHFISRPHSAINMECEKIDKIGDSIFDVVFSRNALDHSESPDLILQHSKTVCKDGGLIHIRMYENEAIRNKYSGLHQWNAKVLNNDILMFSETYNREFTFSTILPKLKITTREVEAQKTTHKEIFVSYICEK